jgi:hypothetical protein
VEVLQGEVLSEVRQSWEGIGSLTTRLWRGRASLEVDWSVGPPPTTGAKGATAAAAAGGSADWEVFVRYSSDVQSGERLILEEWRSGDRFEAVSFSRMREGRGRLQSVLEQKYVHSNPLLVSNLAPSSSHPVAPLYCSQLPCCCSGGVWYTDANGLEWQQRRLGYRPSYNFKDNNLPANIYPITTGVWVLLMWLTEQHRCCCCLLVIVLLLH